MKSNSPLSLDAIDRKLLEWVQADATQPLTQLAEACGLSTSLCWRRLQRLVIAGTTVGWRLLQPDASALQNGERTVVAVRLQDGEFTFSQANLPDSGSWLTI